MYQHEKYFWYVVLLVRRAAGTSCCWYVVLLVRRAAGTSAHHLSINLWFTHLFPSIFLGRTSVFIINYVLFFHILHIICVSCEISGPLFTYF